MLPKQEPGPFADPNVPVGTYERLVSELPGYPSHVNVLSIEESLCSSHDILFTGKTALKGTDECNDRWATNIWTLIKAIICSL